VTWRQSRIARLKITIKDWEAFLETDVVRLKLLCDLPIQGGLYHLRQELARLERLESDAYKTSGSTNS
jgi:hypothetical protein